jgi:hypothetical protein
MSIVLDLTPHEVVALVALVVLIAVVIGIGMRVADKHTDDWGL